MRDTPSHALETTPKRVLYLSDTHIGGYTSNVAHYREGILAQMKSHDHVVLIGDIFELLHVDESHHQQLLGLLALLDPSCSEGDWNKAIEARKLQDPHRNHEKSRNPVQTRIEDMIYGAALFLETFMELNPGIKLHMVGGNHENIVKFSNVCEAIQAKFPYQFEWSPEAVQLGDALITHGHLPYDGKTRKQYGVSRLRDVSEDAVLPPPYDGEKTRWFHHRAYDWASRTIGSAETKAWYDFTIRWFHRMEHHLRQSHRQPENLAARILGALYGWNGTEDFMVSHRGEHKPLAMESIHHIFFGHTHIKFHHFTTDERHIERHVRRLGEQIRNAQHPEQRAMLAHQLEMFLQNNSTRGITLHNTGAVVRATSDKPKGLGILESELMEDGRIVDVRPVVMQRDAVRQEPRHRDSDYWRKNIALGTFPEMMR